jgi:outer membrane protein assembly factor BamC
LTLKDFRVKNITRLSLLGIAVALSACSVLENDKIDYKSAKKGVTLEVPPDLTSCRATRATPCPAPASRPASCRQARPVTPPLEKAAALTVGDVTIERDGNQRWLVVNRPADKLWDPVRDFWLENGFNMAMEKPELGILETDWAENRAKLPQDIIRSTLGKVFDSLYSTSERDRSAPAWSAAPMARPKSTSPTAACRRSTPASQGQHHLAARAADPELETEFLRRIMVKLGTKSSPRPWSPRAAPSPPWPVGPRDHAQRPARRANRRRL